MEQSGIESIFLLDMEYKNEKKVKICNLSYFISIIGLLESGTKDCDHCLKFLKIGIRVENGPRMPHVKLPKCAIKMTIL